MNRLILAGTFALLFFSSTELLATSLDCHHAFYPSQLSVSVKITPSEIWDTDYVGVFSEATAYYAGSEWGVAQKPTTSAQLSHYWTYSPFNDMDYLDVVARMVTEWDGQRHGAHVSDYDTETGCTAYSLNG